MKILVTGATGYLGSNFIKFCKEEYEFVQFSLVKNKLESINFKDIDTVLHCAALVHQKKEHPYSYYNEINTEYPKLLAKLAKDNGVKHFVFISTIAVYGLDQEKIHLGTPFNIQNDYAKSKLEAEKVLMDMQTENFKISIVRPPMIYGKNAPGNIQNLKVLIQNFRIIPLGGLNNLRTFVYIDNLCFGLKRIIELEKNGEFLISDSESVSTTHLISEMANSMKKRVILVNISVGAFFIKYLFPNLYKKLFTNLVIDNSETLSKLDYISPFSFKEGIKSMLKEDTIVV